MPMDGQISKKLGDIKKKVEDKVEKPSTSSSTTATKLPSSSTENKAKISKGKTLYVCAQNGSNRNTGEKGKPVKDLQKAIDISSNGDEILIAQGNYLGTLNQGFIQITDKYISLIGGYSSDFSERDPVKYVTSIIPPAGISGTCNNKGTFHIYVKGNPQGTLVIDGFVLDRGDINKYCAPDPNDPRTSTPNDQFISGRIVDPDASPSVKFLGDFTIREPIMRGDVEGNLIVRNCIFANGGNYAIMMNIKKGHFDIYNNLFVANRFAACQIRGNSIRQDECTIDFHHNTVMFSWCRTKVMEDMGYGFRYMPGAHARVYNNIFVGNNLGALDRGYFDSDKNIEAKRISSAMNNYFFMNKSDLILPSGGGLWLRVAAEQFEDVEQLDEYEGNKQLPESEIAFVDAINQPYLEAFATISSSNTSNFEPNSAANRFNKAVGMNLQGSETIRPTMYANRYPLADIYKLWGKVNGYGAQTPKNEN